MSTTGNFVIIKVTTLFKQVNQQNKTESRLLKLCNEIFFVNRSPINVYFTLQPCRSPDLNPLDFSSFITLKMQFEKNYRSDIDLKLNCNINIIIQVLFSLSKIINRQVLSKNRIGALNYFLFYLFAIQKSCYSSII